MEPKKKVTITFFRKLSIIDKIFQFLTKIRKNLDTSAALRRQFSALFEAGKPTKVTINLKNAPQLEKINENTKPTYKCQFHDANSNKVWNETADYGDGLDFDKLECSERSFNISNSDWERKIGVKLFAIFEISNNEIIEYEFDSEDTFVTIFDCSAKTPTCSQERVSI